MQNDAIPLREYLDRILSETDLRVSQRFEAQEQAVRTAMAAAEKAVNAAMAAAEKAVAKAEMSTEKRLEAVNEFRQSLSDQQATFVRQDVVNARFEKFDALIAVISANATENKGRGAGLNAAWGYLLAVIMSGVAVVSFFK